VGVLFALLLFLYLRERAQEAANLGPKTGRV
jgi:hypothetical protein